MFSYLVIVFSLASVQTLVTEEGYADAIFARLDLLESKGSSYRTDDSITISTIAVEVCQPDKTWSN